MRSGPRLNVAGRLGVHDLEPGFLAERRSGDRRRGPSNRRKSPRELKLRSARAESSFRLRDWRWYPEGGRCFETDSTSRPALRTPAHRSVHAMLPRTAIDDVDTIPWSSRPVWSRTNRSASSGAATMPRICPSIISIASPWTSDHTVRARSSGSPRRASFPGLERHHDVGDSLSEFHHPSTDFGIRRTLGKQVPEHQPVVRRMLDREAHVDHGEVLHRAPWIRRHGHQCSVRRGQQLAEGPPPPPRRAWRRLGQRNGGRAPPESRQHGGPPRGGSSRRRRPHTGSLTRRRRGPASGCRGGTKYPWVLEDGWGGTFLAHLCRNMDVQ